MVSSQAKRRTVPRNYRMSRKQARKWEIRKATAEVPLLNTGS